MQFPTVQFVVFFGVVLTGAWALRDRPTLRKLWLVAAGAWFYASWDVRFLGLLAALVVLTWGVGRLLAAVADVRRRRALLVLGVAADLVLLGYFKYYGFFADSLMHGLARVGIHVEPPLLVVALPIGISFVTFQSISYLVDVRRQRIGARTLLDVATWLTFFPTVTSGPITRAVEFMPQLDQEPRNVRADLGRAYWLICRGLLKKLVIASFLATAITDPVFADPAAFSSLTVLIAIYSYAVLIYCDFSGYTDLAIGIARLLGFALPENFNRPYTATSVQDFWSRWHMTLSRWLRDYLFAPLVGRPPQRPARVYASLLAVMLLAGLWHGAAWGFVVFGGVHGVAMVVERWRRDRRRRLHRPLPTRTRSQLVGSRVGTFHIVCLGWVFFASESIGRAVDVLEALVTNWTLPVTLLTPLLLLTVAGVIAVQYLPQAPVTRVTARLARWHPAAQAAGFALASVPILAMAPTTVPSFIYYRF